MYFFGVTSFSGFGVLRGNAKGGVGGYAFATFVFAGSGVGTITRKCIAISGADGLNTKGLFGFRFVCPPLVALAFRGRTRLL